MGWAEKFASPLKPFKGVVMNCIYCNSTKIKIINGSFPITYECQKCKRLFIEPNPMLM